MSATDHEVIGFQAREKYTGSVGRIWWHSVIVTMEDFAGRNFQEILKMNTTAQKNLMQKNNFGHCGAVFSAAG